MNLRFSLCLWSSFVFIASSSLSFAQNDKPVEKSPAVMAVEAVGGRVQQISAQSKDREVNVSLVGDRVDDALVAKIGSIKNVIWLNLARTQVTDAGLKPVAQLKGLTKLHLEKTSIGDDGMQHLSGLEQLEYLNIYGTQVSDKGLVHLKSLKNLKKLYVWQTGVTEAGMKDLNAALPNLTITGGISLKPDPAAKEKKEGKTDSKDKNDKAK